jgi:hypothetical protein
MSRGLELGHWGHGNVRGRGGDCENEAYTLAEPPDLETLRVISEKAQEEEEQLSQIDCLVCLL